MRDPSGWIILDPHAPVITGPPLERGLLLLRWFDAKLLGGIDKPLDGLAHDLCSTSKSFDDGAPLLGAVIVKELLAHRCVKRVLYELFSEAKRCGFVVRCGTYPGGTPLRPGLAGDSLPAMQHEIVFGVGT
jgi:hypothetical protein